MQKQQISLSLNTQDQASGPVEIDASLLHLVGGGTPKGTWGPAQEGAPVEDQTAAALAESPTPKGTW